MNMRAFGVPGNFISRLNVAITRRGFLRNVLNTSLNDMTSYPQQTYRHNLEAYTF